MYIFIYIYIYVHTWCIDKVKELFEIKIYIEF